MSDADTPAPDPAGRTPYLVAAVTLAGLFLFAAAAYFVAGGGPAGPTAEQKLADLRAAEEKILTTAGKDPATGAVRVPIDRAVESLAAEAEKAGSLPYPQKPKAAPK